jgi:tetratricopeptide (TPR) repeat protein
MTGKIFINYRRDDSIGTAGRLHDRLAQTFGRKNLFMDIDHIPAGVDFEAHLNSQLAECGVILVVIGSKWLKVKDKAGQRRLYQQGDFVAIEVAAALARNIPVIPVLVDGTPLPKASDLPDSLKSLVRRQAVEIRQTYFGRDADALIARMREIPALFTPRPWRRIGIVGAAVVTVLLTGVGGYAQRMQTVEQSPQQREAAPRPAELRARFDSLIHGSTNINGVDLHKAIAIFSEAIRFDPNSEVALHSRGVAYYHTGDPDRAIADYNEVIRLNKDAAAFINRGHAYTKKGDYDRALADLSEAIRLNPSSARPFNSRGHAYYRKGDYDRAIADYSEAIRLSPTYARAFCNRGHAKLRSNDISGNADIAKAKQLDASVCQ